MKYVLLTFFVFIMTFSGTLGAYFLKLTVGKLGKKHIFQLILIPTLYAGGMFYVLGAIMNILLLNMMDYTVVYPMTSLTYVWTLFFSHFVLNEKINVYKVVATILIVLGVIAIAL